MEKIEILKITQRLLYSAQVGTQGFAKFYANVVRGHEILLVQEPQATSESACCEIKCAQMLCFLLSRVTM